MAADFVVERRAFARELEGLLPDHENAFAVYIGDRRVAIAPDEDAAIEAGFNLAHGPAFFAERISRRSLEPVRVLFLP